MFTLLPTARKYCVAVMFISGIGIHISMISYYQFVLVSVLPCIHFPLSHFFNKHRVRYSMCLIFNRMLWKAVQDIHCNGMAHINALTTQQKILLRWRQIRKGKINFNRFLFPLRKAWFLYASSQKVGLGSCTFLTQYRMQLNHEYFLCIL